MKDAARPTRVTPSPAKPSAAPSFENKVEQRFKLMMRHTWLIMTSVLLALAGLVALWLYTASQPVTLKIAVGPPGSDDVKIIQGLAQHFARERANIRLNVIVQGGPAEAADSMDAGQADLAVVRRDLAMPKNGQTIAILRTNVVTIMVPAAGAIDIAANAVNRKTRAPKAKKIEKIEDLAGRRLGVIGRSDANVRLLNAILTQYEIALDKVSITQFSTQDVATAIRDAKVDAIMTVGPVSSRITADVIAAVSRGKEPPAFLSIGAAEAIAARNPVYEATEIPAGAFGGSPLRPEEALDTVGFSHYIVARRSLDEQQAADFTRLLFAARQSLAVELPAISKIEKPDTDKDAAVAVHPGAAAYIDGDQKTFFDRYSDLMYWGLILMSFLGSAGAWLLSYAKADNRVSNLKALDQLIELAKNARKAVTVEDLETIRTKTDAIVKKAIRQVEAGQIEESGLMAFSLALDQAQCAISDRQAVLLLERPRKPVGVKSPPDDVFGVPEPNKGP